MKRLIKLLIRTIVILVLLFSAAYIFVAVKGKALLTQKLEDALKREVSIGALSINLPLRLEIKDLNIEGLASADYVYVSLSLTGLLRGKINLNELKILKPEINWEKQLPAKEPVKNNPTNNNIEIEEALAQTKEILHSPKVKNRPPPPIMIKHITIEQGVVNLADWTISKSGIKISVRDIFLNVDNLALFSKKSAIINYQLNAKIPWQRDSGEGTVYLSGWIDLRKKDIEARLELEGIDAVSLYPYYSQWVDLENARIEQANLNFISEINGRNNNVVARCRLELTDIKFRPRPPDEPEHKAEKITTAVLGMFRALNQGKVVLRFTIRTTMDRPEFNFSMINNAVDETLTKAVKSGKVSAEDIAVLPGRFIEGIANGASDATQAIIDGAISVGKSLTEAIADIFKMPGEEQEEEEENIFGNYEDY